MPKVRIIIEIITSLDKAFSNVYGGGGESCYFGSLTKTQKNVKSMIFNISCIGF